MPHPFGLTYASGPQEVLSAVPSSAFSQGDILMFDSNSSLSRWPAGAASPGEIAGVALSASTASYRDHCQYIIPNPATVFWSRATTGSTFTAGEELELEYVSAIFMVSTSNTTPNVVVTKGSKDMDDDRSDLSYVHVKLLSSGGELEWL